MSSLEPLDWATCIGYVVLVFGLGLWFGRQQRSNEDFFVGGRRMNWLVVGLSTFATAFSSLSFVGLPTVAAFGNYHLYLSILLIPLLVTPVVWWLFVPLYHRLKVTTAYEYLERRFNRPIRLVSSGMFGVYTILWVGTMLYAVGVYLQAVLGLTEKELRVALVAVGILATVYTTIGGIKAVIWTDVLQTVTLGGGMLVVLLLAVSHIDGGWDTVWRVGTAYDKFEMFDMRWDLSEENFYSAVAFALFVYMSTFSVQQSLMQRYVAVPNVAAARRGLIVSGVVTAAICLLFFVVGSTLFVFYHHSLAAGAAAESGFPELPQKDQLVPHFVMTVIPRFGLTGLLLAGLFAAAMSSVDSAINALTALVVCDWLPGRKLSVGFSRWLCFSFGIAVIFAAMVVGLIEGAVFEKIMKIAGAFQGPLLGVFFLGLLVKRANAPGAAIGMVIGVSTVPCLIWSQEWFGVQISHWWYGASCVPTVVAGTLSSLLFQPPSQEKTNGLALDRSLTWS